VAAGTNGIFGITKLVLVVNGWRIEYLLVTHCAVSDYDKVDDTGAVVFNVTAQA
jgi:hypothetical protein